LRLSIKFFVFFCAFGLSTPLVAQDPCGSPSAARLFVSTLPSDETASNLGARRAAIAANKLGSALADKLKVTHACILRDISSLDDPRNFPALKGSVVFQIKVAASDTNPDIAAISVEINAAQDVDANKSFHIATLPLLLEKGTSYEFLADDIFHYWNFMSACISNQKCPDKF